MVCHLCLELRLGVFRWLPRGSCELTDSLLLIHFLPSSLNHLLQGERVAWRVSVLVIIKVTVNILSGLRPRLAFLGPGAKCPGRIISLICVAGTMKSDIHKISGNNFRGPSAGQMIQAEGRIISLKHVIHRLGKPTLFAEFKGIAKGGGQVDQKFFQPGTIHSPVRRQLKQDRAQLAVKNGHNFKKAFDALLGILELFHVRNVSAALAGKDEIFRGLRRPMFHGGHGRQMVKSVIEFHGAEMCGVKS